MLLSLGLAACGGIEVTVSAMDQRHTEVEETSYAVGDAPRLDVKNMGGSITVRASEGETAKVVSTKRAAREKDLDKIQVTITEGESGLLIETDRPSHLKNVSVDLEIAAPYDARLDLYTAGGNIKVGGLENSVRINTGGGNVDVHDIKGNVDAHTGGGNVEICDVSGDVDADTGGGNIEILGISGDVLAHTGGGNIGVRDVSGEAHLSTGAGNIDYQGQPQGDYRLRTGAGTITVRLPKNANVVVDLETGTGKVKSDLNVQGHVTSRWVSGAIGSGDEGEIHASTGAGDIRLIRE
jgi:DUF4097 and DUF4098 domain-containing protein YvlB